MGCQRWVHPHEQHILDVLQLVDQAGPVALRIREGLGPVEADAVVPHLLLLPCPRHEVCRHGDTCHAAVGLRVGTVPAPVTMSTGCVVASGPADSGAVAGGVAACHAFTGHVVAS